MKNIEKLSLTWDDPYEESYTYYIEIDSNVNENFPEMNHLPIFVQLGVFENGVIDYWKNSSCVGLGIENAKIIIKKLQEYVDFWEGKN
ncbi:hypothetical protein EDM57_04330 [Brevibacillus gelatini]|uniref:Uncharacterized protein n=1 Tax=Brevibacillus gelatini TaxID=1655277 RepID=A0A3M8B7G0_9BACL|nr:hypothetical protein [Brevibacillus gelatini]RNB59376.1 hypothetical protein EDM57_04330 [Brevibacillus gelatini]